MSKLKAIGKDLCHFFMYANDFVSGVKNQWKKSLGLKQYRTLDNIVEEAKEATGKEQVNLIGHSFGGLKAFVYALENPDKVKNCMMIGAPLNGTRLAYLGGLFIALGIVPESALQMIPNTAFISAIQAYFQTFKEDFKDINFINFVSKSDELVSLERTCIQNIKCEDENIQEFILKDEGHVSMTYHPLVQKKLKELLIDSENPTIFLHGFGMQKTFFKKILKKLSQEYSEIKEKKHKEKRFHFSYDYTKKIKSRKIMEWYNYQTNDEMMDRDLLYH